MTPDMITLYVLAVLAILFVTELVPMAITSVGGAMALGLLNIIPMNQAFSGMSNSNVVLFTGMFIIGAAMFHTGLAQTLGEWVVSKVGQGEKALMFGSMSTCGMLSSVTSNTGATAVMMPIVQGLCKVAKIPQSRQLLPLAYAAGMGGLLTLVGSPPNIIVSETLGVMGFRTFSFFEFSLIGIPLMIAGFIYILFFGNRFFPSHPDAGNDAEIALKSDRNLFSKPTEKNTHKMCITAVVLFVVLVIMALDLKRIPMYYAAIIGAMVCILTKCVTEKQAYQAIDLVTLFVLAGMLPVAEAMDKTGAGKLIANTVLDIIGSNPSPTMIMISLFLMAAILTQFMTNTATTALLAPIGVSIAKALGASPHAVLMAICVGATCAFLTPVGSAPCTLVLGPGGYKFMDYVKSGFGLLIVYFILGCILVPIIWPFFPG